MKFFTTIDKIRYGGYLFMEIFVVILFWDHEPFMIALFLAAVFIFMEGFVLDAKRDDWIAQWNREHPNDKITYPKYYDEDDWD